MDFSGGAFPSGTVTFGVGETSKTIIVNVVADGVVEPQDGFTVTLSGPSAGLTIGTASASGTIIDGIGLIYRVSISAVGTPGFDPRDPVFSPDGSKVAFSSWASNLAPGDTNGQSDVFIKDLVTGTVTRVSATPPFGLGGDGAFFPVFSPDGSKIAFAGFTEGDVDSQLLVKDLATGNVTVASSDSSGAWTDGAGSSAPTDFSPDGTKVAFDSTAPLVADDTNGTWDVYVKDLGTGAIARVSTDSVGAQSNDTSSSAAFSPDGTKIAFYSTASNLVAGDTNGVNDVFVKDLATGAIARLSTDGDGTQGNGHSFGPVFSPDGAKIAFYSAASNLVVGDTNGAEDIFIKDLTTGAVTLVSAGVGGTQGNGASRYVAFSPDGTKIAFISFASNLVAGDTNGAYDVFVKDLVTGSIFRVSTDAAGNQAEGPSARRPRFSSDGSKLVFESGANNLVAGDLGSAGILVRLLSFVSVTAADAVKAEGSSGTTDFTFTVTRSGDTSLTQSVDWSITGTGVHPTAAGDFGGALPAGTVSFVAGETTKTITVAVTGDVDMESDEGFTVTLSNATAGLLVDTAAAAGTIVNDDLVVTVSEASLLGPADFAAYESVTILDTPRNLQRLSASAIGDFASAGVDFISSTTGFWSLTAAQYLALGAIGLHAGDSVTLVDLAATIGGFSPSALDGLAAKGVDIIKPSGGRLTLNLDQYNHLNGVPVLPARSLTLQDDALALSGLSAAQIAQMNADGVGTVVSTEGSFALDVAQSLALGKIKVDGAPVTLSDTGAAIASLNKSQIAGLAGRGFDAIDSTTDTLTLNVARYQALGPVSLTSADLVTLADAAASIEALAPAELAALGAKGIDVIDATKNLLSLTVAQFQALNNVIVAASDAIKINGTAANDLIAFTTQRFKTTGQFDGGDGNDQLTLGGSYPALAFQDDTITNVERLRLLAGNGYDITLANGNVGSGQSLAVDATSLGASDSLIFNGSHETDGTFKFLGGVASSTFTGGNNGDTLTAGTGSETFRYTAPVQSTGVGYDSISGFDATLDRFDIWTSVTAMDGPVTSGRLTSGNFDSLLSAAASGLGTHHAMLLTPDSGNLAGATFLLVDTNGAAGYQSGQDLVMRLNNTAGALTAGNFV